MATKNNDFQSKKVLSFEYSSDDAELDAFLPTGRTKNALEGSDIGSARGGLFHLPDEENVISGHRKRRPSP